MTRLLIPDSGPLFSLAAGGLLDLLLHFTVGITDVVKSETIDRGSSAKASAEARSLHAFFQTHLSRIQLLPTQVGRDVQALRAGRSNYKPPRNLGELSIQSLLIDLQLRGVRPPPVVLFEDGWFLRNAPSLARLCVLLSTQAFLVNAERLGLIDSAAAASEAIHACRPGAGTRA